MDKTISDFIKFTDELKAQETTKNRIVQQIRDAAQNGDYNLVQYYQLKLSEYLKNKSKVLK